MKRATRTQRVGKFKSDKMLLPMLVFVILVVLFIVCTYSVLNHFATEIVTVYLTELVAHDKANIRDYVADRYSIMSMVHQDLKARDPQGLNALMDELHTQAGVRNVERLYLIDEDGYLYSSEHSIHPAGENPFLSYYSGREDRIVGRYDETDENGEPVREYMLYARGFQDDPLQFSPEGPGSCG